MSDDRKRAKALEDFKLEIPYPRCHTGKVPWISEQEAQIAADKLNATPDGNGVNETYHCKKCGWWHAGRKHKGRTVH